MIKNIQKYNNQINKPLRQNLRNHSTPAETELWKYLSRSQLLGRKFRRQFGVCNYILDFYCSTEKLGVELDGEHHFSPDGEKYDVYRSRRLEKMGVRVIRFENKWVFEDIEWVLRCIVGCFR